VLGGDYGFADNPQGTNARDLAHFVKHFGFSPGEALQAATRIGLVDGDPLADIRVLQDKKRLSLIMKGGVRYQPCEGAPHVRRLR
jgi:imidazolonepropionase-like amidohydrolase